MMTDPAVKIALALCVLLAGVFGATLFRHHGPPHAPAQAAAEPLSIPYRVGDGDAGRRSGPATRPTVLTPSGRAQSPPPLAQEHPSPDRPADSRWGRSMESMLPVPAPDGGAMRSHRIVDGDTLAALAQRYLGSASRADEIFAANRDVLFDPQLLPIGATLKIPPRERRP